MLLIFVILLPLAVTNEAGSGDPWFCKYICPSGTLLGGIPLTALNSTLRSAAGILFGWKTAVLAAVIFLSWISYRPFCRYLCPLGAVYSVFNGVSLYRYTVDKEKCTACGKCRKQCKMDIGVFESPNNPECIRCGECIKACPHGAVSSSFAFKKQEKAEHIIQK